MRQQCAIIAFVLILLVAMLSGCAVPGVGQQSTPTPIAEVPRVGQQPESVLTAEHVQARPEVRALLTDLEARGIAASQPEDVSRVGLLNGAPGYAYRLGAGWLHIHVYSDDESLERDVARIPPTGDNGMMDWVAAPHFFRCENLIALYLGSEEQVRHALTDRCGPQFAGFE